MAGIWFFRHRPIGFEDAISFGIGAGSFEALAIVAYSLWLHLSHTRADEDALRQWRENAPRSIWVRYYMPIERLGALFGHVGARGLVALGAGSSSVLQGVGFALIPLATFSAVDGIASFGEAKRWRWLDPQVARPFYTFALLAGAFELALFLALALVRG